MRNALSLVLGVATLSLLAACGDASDSSGNQRKPNVVIGAVDGEPVIGEHDSNPANPSADVPPPPPAAAGESTGQVGAALSSATPLADLGASTELTVTLTPSGAFSGDFALTATGLPTGVTATFTPATVTMANAVVTAKVMFTVDTTAIPATAPAAVVIKATSGAVSASANANFKVNPKIQLTFPMNLAALTTAGGAKFTSDFGGAAFGANPQPVTIPADVAQVDVVVFNNDSTSHILHGAGAFPHGDTNNPIPAGKFEVDPNDATKNRVRALKAGTIGTGYSHELPNGSSVSFQVKGVAP